MKKIFTLVLLLTITTTLQAQKKSELLAKIETLKTELSEVKSELVHAKKNEKVSSVEAESAKKQAEELQKINTSLMQNLSKMTSSSIEKSNNIGQTLENLKDKEQKIKSLNDTFSKNDSIALIVLTNFKKSLGENTEIAVRKGAIVVTLNETTRTSLQATDTIANAPAVAFLGKIASVLTNTPTMDITIEGLSNTGELNIAAQQATNVSTILQNKFGIDPNRITITSKDGGFTEGMLIQVHPKYASFYFNARESLKEK